MCGIAGIIDPQNGLAPEYIGAFTHALRHRGPDDQSTFVSDNAMAALGHCRLAILDMSDSANQPFKSADGRYVLVFNGEIYNYLELKAQLQSLGYVFQTTSDSEVLLTAYIEWGKECLARFNGMWAFAIWDCVEQTMFLSRDRFGVKSLYFQNKGNSLSFASEQKAFATLPGSLIIDADNLAKIISFPEIVESQRFTLYQDIFKLLPGEYALFAQGKLTIGKWWNTYDEIKKAESQVSVDELTSLFSSACDIRTRSDAKIATSLSGGVDSSVVTSQATRYCKPHHELKAFIGSFAGSKMDEFKWAQQVCHKNDIEYVRVNIEQNDVINTFAENAMTLEDVNELPALGQAKLYKTMQQHGYKVSLEGHGGDELFAGYPRHLNAYLAQVIKNQGSVSELATSLISLSNTKPDRGPAYLKGNILQLSTDPTKLHMKANTSKPYLTRFMYSDAFPATLAVKEQSDPQYANESLLFKKLYEDFHYLTLPYILRNYDRLSMRYGIEVRSPMLDYRFVIASLRAPSHFKIAAGTTKHFLRHSVVDLPAGIVNRTDKLGFTPPIIGWLKAGLATAIQDRINVSKVAGSNCIDGQQLLNTVNQIIKNKDFAKLTLYWPLINVALLQAGE